MVDYSIFGNFRRNIIQTLVCLLLLSVSVSAQRNGDVLAFQGFEEPNDMSVKALALGGTFTAENGNLGSIFYNPAGLATIDKFQISLTASYSSRMWRDNQIWYPGGDYQLLPHYMENLYTPPAEFNGIWSDSLGGPGGGWNPDDIRSPVSGADPFSAEAADAETTINTFAFDQISIAYPFNISGINIIAAAALNANYNPVDYDWNGDHLDPHWGTSEDISQYAPEDSIVRSDWDVYTRQRSNGIKSLKGALAFKLYESFQIGAGFTSLFGSTDDIIALQRIGYYQFVQAGDNWSFTYENRQAVRSGTSEISSLMFNMGGLVVFKNLSFGFNFNLPHTVTRDWKYNDVITTDTSSQSFNSSGKDEMKVPLSFDLGLKFLVKKNLSLYADLKYKPYEKAEFSSTSPIDSTNFPVWTNQYTFSGGVEFRPTDDLSLMAGYRTQTATFVGYGNATRDKGSPIDSYTFGASYNLPYGEIAVTYEYRTLKYYDVYFSSRNYTLVSTSNLLFGYTLSI